MAGTSINPKLEETIDQLLKDVAQNCSADLDLRLKVIDRALNLEKLKLKMAEDEYGSGFSDDTEDGS